MLSQSENSARLGAATVITERAPATANGGKLQLVSGARWKGSYTSQFYASGAGQFIIHGQNVRTVVPEGRQAVICEEDFKDQSHIQQVLQSCLLLRWDHSLSRVSRCPINETPSVKH